MTPSLPPFSGGTLPASFERRRVVLAPGSSRPFVDAEWRDALVTIDSGALELECRRGTRRRFPAGSILWFSDLGLRAMHNHGSVPAVLVAISRRSPS